MKRKMISAMALVVTASMIAVGFCESATHATNVYEVLPASGVALVLEEGTSLDSIYVEQEVSTTESYAAGVSGNGEADASDERGEISISDSFVSSNDRGAVVSANEQTGNATESLFIDSEGSVELATQSTMVIGIGTERAESLNDQLVQAAEEELARDPENFSNLVIAQVTNYVNVRDIPSEDGEIVGKLYDDSVGTYIEEVNGWYKITSGNVTGYVKAEFCVTGDEAIALAREVGSRMATVTTTTLKVRTEPSTESEVLGLVPIEEDLSVLEELDGWVRVSIEEGEGYVSAEYVELRTDFVTAESREEEEARLERERQAQLEAQAAARAAAQNNQSSGNSNSTYAPPVITGDNSLGVSVAEYACQFVGNPYVYGGTSLTNGADCSGFVMSVYAAFGVSLPHSSAADRSQGYAVEGGLANAQPGDLVCYSGHVAIYIGNGQIVHASTSRTGIIISNAGYRNVLAVRRIF